MLLHCMAVLLAVLNLDGELTERVQASRDVRMYANNSPSVLYFSTFIL